MIALVREGGNLASLWSWSARFAWARTEYEQEVKSAGRMAALLGKGDFKLKISNLK
jgi:hypothetical protein